MVLRYWIALNAADAVLTALGLALGATEANPVLNAFALRVGHPGMLFIKALFAIAIGGVLWERSKVRMLTGMNYLMTAVVIYNMIVISYTL